MKLLTVAGCLLLSMLQAQTGLPPGAPEMNTREETTASFKSHVNLVTVPVVARNSRGVAVGDLTKENFQLFDKGRPQEITRFSVEKIGSKPPLDPNANPATAGAAEENAPSVVVPERFVAY